MLQDATSAEPKPGVFAIVREIRARSGNVRLQTRHLVSLQLHQERKLGTLRNGDTNLLATA